jgi:hypothetical protein
MIPPYAGGGTSKNGMQSAGVGSCAQCVRRACLSPQSRAKAAMVAMTQKRQSR